MNKLKEAYDIKKELISKDIAELGEIIKDNTNINTVNINPDNTIYLESECGIDSIRNSLDLDVIKWINGTIKIGGVINAPINMVYNTLPLTSNTCIIRIWTVII